MLNDSIIYQIDLQNDSNKKKSTHFTVLFHRDRQPSCLPILPCSPPTSLRCGQPCGGREFDWWEAWWIVYTSQLGNKQLFRYQPMWISIFVVWGGVELNSFVCCANLDGFRFTVSHCFAVAWYRTCASWLLFDLKVSLAGFFFVCVWVVWFLYFQDCPSRIWILDLGWFWHCDSDLKFGQMKVKLCQSKMWLAERMGNYDNLSKMVAALCELLIDWYLVFSKGMLRWFSEICWWDDVCDAELP